MMYVDFFYGKTVLVTGHTGFKGSWLSLWLENLGAKVIGFALDPYTTSDNFVISKLSNRMTDIRGDVRNLDDLSSVVKKYDPEIIFHLAAQPLLTLSYKIPRETVETNVMGTVNVLEAFRKSKRARTLIVVTSDKCYENREWVYGYREIDPLGGYDPYSSSKAAAELIVSAYIRSFLNPDNYDSHRKVVATVRAGNVLGGGDWREGRILPDCIRAIESDKEMIIRNPDSVRPWQFVLEPLNGYLLLASMMHNDPKRYSGSWNFGPAANSIITVRKLAEKVIKYYGKGSMKEIQNKADLHESKLLNLDISKATYLLGWKPKLNIDETIKMTVEWYKNYKNESIESLIERQIIGFATLSRED
jgi:CDP-glucose 4,6-dehydratase